MILSRLSTKSLRNSKLFLPSLRFAHSTGRPDRPPIPSLERQWVDQLDMHEAIPVHVLNSNVSDSLYSYYFSSFWCERQTTYVYAPYLVGVPGKREHFISGMCVRAGVLCKCLWLQVCVIQCRGGDDLVAGSGDGCASFGIVCACFCGDVRGVDMYTGWILPTALLHKVALEFVPLESSSDWKQRLVFSCWC